MPLTDLFPTGSREEAAKTFYDALVLQGKGLATIAEQSQPFEVLQVQFVQTE